MRPLQQFVCTRLKRLARLGSRSAHAYPLASILLQDRRAAAHTALVGIRPQIAQCTVALGVDLRDLPLYDQKIDVRRVT